MSSCPYCGMPLVDQDRYEKESNQDDLPMGERYGFSKEAVELIKDLYFNQFLRPYNVYKKVVAEAERGNWQIGSRASFYRMLWEMKDALTESLG